MNPDTTVLSTAVLPWYSLSAFILYDTVHMYVDGRNERSGQSRINARMILPTIPCTHSAADVLGHSVMKERRSVTDSLHVDQKTRVWMRETFTTESSTAAVDSAAVLQMKHNIQNTGQRSLAVSVVLTCDR